MKVGYTLHQFVKLVSVLVAPKYPSPPDSFFLMQNKQSDFGLQCFLSATMKCSGSVSSNMSLTLLHSEWLTSTEFLPFRVQKG